MKQISISEKVAVELTIEAEIERCAENISLASKDYYRDKKKKLKAFLRKITKNDLYYGKE